MVTSATEGVRRRLPLTVRAWSPYTTNRRRQTPTFANFRWLSTTRADHRRMSASPFKVRHHSMTAVTVIYRIKYISLIRLYYNCANPFSTPSAAIPSPFSSLSDFDRHILRYSKNPPLLKQCERDPIGNCRGICSFGIPIVSSDTVRI